MAIKIIENSKDKIYRANCQCGCSFEYEKEDVIFKYGMPGVNCPSCGEFYEMEDKNVDEFIPTLKDVKYPKHFTMEKGVPIEDSKINEALEIVIKHMLNHPDDWGYYSTGELTIVGLPWDDAIEILVMKNAAYCICER